MIIYIHTPCFQEHPKGMTDPSSIRRAQLGLLSTAGGGKHTHLTQWSLHRYVHCFIICLHLIWTNVLVFVFLLYIYMYTGIIYYRYMYDFCEFACLQHLIATYSSAPQTPGAEASQPRGVSLPGVGPVAQRQEAELDLGRSWWMR